MESEKNILAQGNVSDRVCSKNRPHEGQARSSTGLETGSGDALGGLKMTKDDSDFSPERMKTNDDTKRSVDVNKCPETSGQQVTSSEEGHENSKEFSELNVGHFDKSKKTQHVSSENDVMSEEETLNEKYNGERTSSSNGEGKFPSNVHASPNLGRRDNFDQGRVVEKSKKQDDTKTSTDKSLMSRLIEGGRKLSSGNKSPKATRKSENSGDASELGEANSSLATNIKKNVKNRFADVSIRFRKNDDTVSTSEIRLPSDDSEDNLEPARPDGKRNILAAAQERGRAFIPELKNKFSGLSNRSPRLERKRDWEKVIYESKCRTRILQI